MSVELSDMQRPATRKSYPADKAVAEFDLTGPQAQPTATTDPNVYVIPQIQKAIDEIEDAGGTVVEATALPENEEAWQFIWRFSGATAADTDGHMILWFFNRYTGEAYPSTKIALKGVNKLTAALGGSYGMIGILGCTHVGVQVVDLAAGDTVHILHSIA